MNKSEETPRLRFNPLTVASSYSPNIEWEVSMIHHVFQSANSRVFLLTSLLRRAPWDSQFQSANSRVFLLTRRRADEVRTDVPVSIR